MAGESPYFSTINAIWPDLAAGRTTINPARNGVDRYTGKMIHGWDHVQQSMETIFATPFHQRVLRRWVGSFVPIILGKSAVERVITRFFWSIALAIEQWEPCYRVARVLFMGQALPQSQDMTQQSDADLLRLGQAIFRQEGVYYPRGHLGDYTPYQGKQFDYLVQGGGEVF